MEYVNRKGLYVHTQLLVSGLGVVKGIFSQHFFNRSVETLGTSIQRKYVPIEEKESYRWLESFNSLQEHYATATDKVIYSICDREGDIGELLLARKYEHIHYIIRSKDLRKQADGQSIVEVLEQQAPSFCYRQEVTDSLGKKRVADLWVRWGCFVGKPPYRKGGKLPAIPLWVVETKEPNPPAGEEPICWRLLCSQAIDSAEMAQQMIQYYEKRWSIERFHYVLKQGRKVEDLQMVEENALKNAIIIQSWMAVKICELQYLANTQPQATLEDSGFDKNDYLLIWLYLTQIKKNKIAKTESPNIYDFTRLLALLGGSNLQKNRQLGAVSIWRGFQQFKIIKQTDSICKDVGNQ